MKESKNFIMQLKNYSTQINELYFAGLLHDTGKYVHKYNGRKMKHWVASQMFILKNPEICGGYNIEKIANIAAKHHDGYELPKPCILAPNQGVTSDMLQKASSNYDNNSYEHEIKLIREADRKSASSDRASETGSCGNGTSSQFAPLISPIGKLFDIRLAVKHGDQYNVYEYTGKDDSKEEVEKQDKDLELHIENSFKSFMDEIKNIKSVDDLDEVLKKHWSTVNANTWRPNGENLGNTTTSLYDHSKTTAAIAVCEYINSLWDDMSDSVDVLHLLYNGSHLDIRDEVKDILAKYQLKSPNIISATNNEAYVMIPGCLFNNIDKDLKELNEYVYSKYAETVDYELAANWQFKNCRKTFSERVSYRHFGISSVINKITPNVTDSVEELDNITCKDKLIAGYNVNSYNDIINKIISENDSISKVATTFRIFENFNNDVINLLESTNGCTVISSTLSSCIYAVDDDKVHNIEKAIHQIYNRYVDDIIGLYFTYRKYDRYDNTLQHLKNEIETMQNLLGMNNDKAFNTTVLIQNRRYRIVTLTCYEKFLESMKSVEKSLLQRTKELYEDLLVYNSDNDTVHLISKSRMHYMLNKVKEGDNYNKEFIQCAYKYMYDNDKGVIPTQAFIFYEALVSALKEKR